MSQAWCKVVSKKPGAVHKKLIHVAKKKPRDLALLLVLLILAFGQVNVVA